MEVFGVLVVAAIVLGIFAFAGGIRKQRVFGIHPLTFEAAAAFVFAISFGLQGRWLFVAGCLLVVAIAIIVDPYTWKSQGHFSQINAQVWLLSVKVNCMVGVAGLLGFGFGLLLRR